MFFYFVYGFLRNYSWQGAGCLPGLLAANLAILPGELAGGGVFAKSTVATEGGQTICYNTLLSIS